MLQSLCRESNPKLILFIVAVVVLQPSPVNIVQIFNLEAVLREKNRKKMHLTVENSEEHNQLVRETAPAASCVVPRHVKAS